MKGNEWIAWMIFHHTALGQIGMVQSSLSLSKATVDQVLKTRGRLGEKVHRVKVTIDD